MNDRSALPAHPWGLYATDSDGAAIQFARTQSKHVHIG